jgi:hypothetical protein
MAKKKIEGTEEETQKTNKEIRQERRQAGKEIRQERRQMRAINAGRQEMGGEKLYTKKEIRDVNKPFESQPSTPLSGESEAVGIGGKTVKSATVYNDPNAPSERTYEYQKIGDKLEVKSKPTKEQFTALNDDDDFTKGDAVRKVLINDATNNPDLTYEQTKNAVDASKLVAEETEKIVKGVNKQVKEEVKSTTVPTTTETTISTTDPNATVLGGSGATAAGIVGQVPPSQTEWTSVTTRGQGYQNLSKDEILKQAAQAKAKAPQLVVEKLGLQDYYPEAGRDIAVGNFSGSYAGSRTIYSGAGGLLPLGLYDARKRAIAGEIKKKEALLDQIKEVPEISKQFQPYYTQEYMDFISPWVEAYKDKPEELLRNTEFLKRQSQFKAIGENFLKLDTELKEFEKLIQPKEGEAAAYATNGMLEILYNIKSGMLPGKIEDYFSGKKNIAELSNTVRALPSGYKHIDKKMVDLFKDPMKVKRAITPKDGVEWTPELKDKINMLSQSVADGSTDYETYLTVMKEYFDVDFSPMINEWVDGNSLGGLTESEKKEYKRSLQAYAEAQMPAASFIPTIKDVANKNATRYAADKALAGRLAAINWDKEKWEREQSQNPTNALLQAAKADGNSFTQDYSGSKANLMDIKDLTANVYNASGQLVKINGGALKNAPKGTYFLGPGRNQPIDPGNIDRNIYYQPVEGKVSRSGKDWIYSNKGVGFTMKSVPGAGGVMTQEKSPTGILWTTENLPVEKNGVKLESTIIHGNTYFGQTPNSQTTKSKSSDSSGSYNYDSAPTGE